MPGVGRAVVQSKFITEGLRVFRACSRNLMRKDVLCGVLKSRSSWAVNWLHQDVLVVPSEFHPNTALGNVTRAGAAAEFRLSGSFVILACGLQARPAPCDREGGTGTRRGDAEPA